MTIVVTVGNSHVAALKQGWDRIKDRFPEVDMRFFAAPGLDFRKMSLDTDLRFGVHDSEGVSPRTIKFLKASCGGLFVDLSVADAVIHAGWRSNHDRVANLLSLFDCDGINPASGRPKLSHSAYMAFIASIADYSGLPNAWRDLDYPMVYAMPEPRPTESCLASEKAAYRPWAKMLTSGGAGNGLALFDRELSRILDNQGLNYLPPPEEVFLPSGLTDPIYRGGLHLQVDEEYPESDHHHMNAGFGEYVLTAALSRIRQDLNSQKSGA